MGHLSSVAQMTQLVSSSRPEFVAQMAVARLVCRPVDSVAQMVCRPDDWRPVILCTFLYLLFPFSAFTLLVG